MKLKFNKGKSIGKYTLISELGHGGNGQVWCAKSNAGEVAIKILNTTDFNAYSFNRFKSEVEFLKKEIGRKGILNIIDYNLPDKYTSNNYAWYTMPIATPLRKHVSETKMTVEQLIKMFASLSNTLKEFHEKNVYHRDIKPDNLFWYGNEAVLSDFGLVKYPEKEDFTEGHKLGPLFYIAPEMLNTPDKSDASKADVYSFAKTIWVFLTNQNYPIQGEHDLSYKPNLISSFISHQRIYLIDNLINRANKLDPEKRINMTELNNELNEWNNKVEKSETNYDFADKAKEILHLMRPNIDKESQRTILMNKGEAILLRIRNLIDFEIKDFINEVPSKHGWGNNATILSSKKIINVTEDIKNYVSGNGTCYTYAIENPKRVYFWIGAGYEMFFDNKINIVIGFMIKTGSQQIEEPIWTKNTVTILESAEMENSITTLLNEFKENLPLAIDRFLKEMKNAVA